MLRQILGIIAGYGIFVITSLALFKISGQAPHQQATTSFMILTAVYGAVFSFLAGLVTRIIGKTRTLILNYILTFIIGEFALFSLFKSSGNHWTQVLAIVVFAPVSILGAVFYNNRLNK